MALPGPLLGTTSVSTQGRFAIPANTTHQYRVVVELLTDTSTNANVQTHTQGTYVPFDGTGNAP